MSRLSACSVLFGGTMLMAVAGCGQDNNMGPEPGEAATWTVDPDRPPEPADTSIRALVTRVECASGTTGRVLAPIVDKDSQRVIVTYTVERTPAGDADCPGNDLVPQTVVLGSPLGSRPLFDGSCPGAPEGDACEPRQRWPVNP